MLSDGADLMRDVDMFRIWFSWDMFSCMFTIVHLPRPNCTHSTSMLLVFWWSCLIHLVLLL